MNLLVTTQIVDRTDPVLGFFHRWIEECAKHCDTVTVICLKKGEYSLPSNVRVFSLGKEDKTVSKAQYAWRFFRYLYRLRKDYDAVFVHMNPEYVVLGGIWWRLWHKKIVLWYTHRQVNLKLHIAVYLTNTVATAAPESLGIRSKKVHAIGHGIDTQVFAQLRTGELHEPIAIVSVGRITPIKRLEILLDAFALLIKRNIHATLTLIGSPTVPSDEQYKESLLRQIKNLGIEKQVLFAGSKPYTSMPNVYKEQDISINIAPTGGIDKAVLESMASGCLVLVVNQAFRRIFDEDAKYCLFDGTSEDLARHIEALLSLLATERATLSSRLHTRVAQYAGVEQVINALMQLLL